MFKHLASKILLVMLLALFVFNPSQAQNEKKSLAAILIDNTGSLRSQFSDVVTISQGIVDEAHTRGPVSIFNFVSKGDLKSQLAVVSNGSEWSQDRDDLDDFISDLWVVPGQTTLMDAINSMAEKVSAKANEDKDAFGEKVIFLVTDGEERDSKIKEKQLIQNLKESGIKVYAVGLVKDLGRRGPKDKAIDFLTKITKETGGRAVFPKSNSDLKTLLRELFAK